MGSPEVSTIEKILDGRQEEYWKLEDRFEALNNYLVTKLNPFTDKKRIKDIEELAEKVFSRKSIENAIEKGRLSQEYVAETKQKLNNYLGEIENKGLKEIRQSSRLSVDTQEQVESTNIIPFRKPITQSKIEKYLRPITKVAAALVLGFSSFFSKEAYAPELERQIEIPRIEYIAEENNNQPIQKTINNSNFEKLPIIEKILNPFNFRENHFKFNYNSTNDSYLFSSNNRNSLND